MLSGVGLSRPVELPICHPGLTVHSDQVQAVVLDIKQTSATKKDSLCVVARVNSMAVYLGPAQGRVRTNIAQFE